MLRREVDGLCRHFYLSAVQHERREFWRIASLEEETHLLVIAVHPFSGHVSVVRNIQQTGENTVNLLSHLLSRPIL